MKPIHFYLAVILFISISCNQGKQSTNDATKDTATLQTDTITAPAPTAATPTDSIGDIRKKVEAINTAKLEKKRVEFLCDENTVVDRFYKDGSILKIIVDFGTVGDTYAREEYYYDAGTLIFKYEYVESGPACDDCIQTNEYRSYVRDNKVIKYLKNKTAEKCRTCEFEPSSKENSLLRAATVEEIKKILCS